MGSPRLPDAAAGERVLSAAEGARMAVARCRDCGVSLGELHATFCTKEQCPFCGGQLASCDCCVTVLGLSDAERVAVEEYVDDSVEPLRGIMARWVAALEAKGRVRFGSTPLG